MSENVVSKEEMVKLGQLADELRRRPHVPIQSLDADAATLEGLIDLLIVKGVIGSDGEKSPDEIINDYSDRYYSVIDGLIMLLVSKHVIKNNELATAIQTYHDALRRFGPREPFQVVSEWRRKEIKTRLNG